MIEILFDRCDLWIVVYSNVMIFLWFIMVCLVIKIRVNIYIFMDMLMWFLQKEAHICTGFVFFSFSISENKRNKIHNSLVNFDC